MELKTIFHLTSPVEPFPREDHACIVARTREDRNRPLFSFILPHCTSDATRTVDLKILLFQTDMSYLCVCSEFNEHR